MKPLLKWPGGKRKLVDRILAAFPPSASTSPLFEPFVGSAAVALAAGAPGGTLADVNPRLMEFHDVVRQRPIMLCRHLREFPCISGWKDRYASIRTAFNVSLGAGDQPLNAARLLWLNKACFNGLYRENAKGYFNVPPGSYATVNLPDELEIAAVSRALQPHTLLCQGFHDTIEQAPTGARLYVDPPYDPLSPTASFTSYASRPFTWEDQVALAQACAVARDRGVHVVASNHGTDRVRDLWTGLGFTFQNVEGVKRSISCKGAGRGTTVPEVLFTSWEEELEVL